MNDQEQRRRNKQATSRKGGYRVKHEDQRERRVARADRKGRLDSIREREAYELTS